MSAKIVARGLAMAYDGRSESGTQERVSVLQDFDLEVRQGEFLAVLGPSGCGKSTFLNILAGLAQKTSGELSIDGRPLQGINPHQGVVFQGYALLPWRSVLDNIAMGLEIRGIGRSERLATAREYLALVGLEGQGARYPHELSGGMRQRVAIARSLAYAPDVLLMDEPFAALDAQTREHLQDELLRIWDGQRKTIVFITHSLDEAIFLADRVAVMTPRPGRIHRLLDIDLSRPRAADIRNTPAFVALRQQAWEALRGVPESTAATPPRRQEVRA